MDDLKYSSCCGAEAGEYEDVGICPDCKEHCSWMTDKDYEAEQVANWADDEMGLENYK